MDGSAVFVPAVPGSEWIGRVLPGTSPADLPVAGRLFVDYALECAQRFGVAMAQICDWSFSDRLRARFAEPREGYCIVFYQKGAGPAPRGLADLDGIPGPFTQPVADDLVVMWGVALPFHSPADPAYEPVPEEEIRETPPGVYRRTGGRWTRPARECPAVKDAASWLELSMQVLAGRGGYTLPGYSAQRGVHLCRNVVTEFGTEIEAPALLLDNSWCARNVRIGGGVVLGRNAFVGEGTRLSRTVVCDDTLVGENLELEGKIVIGRRIVDAATGTWVDMEEPGLARGIRKAPKWIGAIGRFLAGTSMGRRG